MNYPAIIVVSLIAEAVWETLKMTWENGKFNVDRIGAIVVGLVIALSTGLDLLKMVDVNVAVPYVGQVLSGLLISRGSNFIHDILGTLGTVYQNKKIDGSGDA